MVIKFIGFYKDKENGHESTYSFSAIDSFHAEKRAKEIAQTFNLELINWEPK